jgi:signal peptidase I
LSLSFKAWGRKLWSDWVKPLLIVALVLGSFRSTVVDWNDVPSGSMKPTILEGDRIFVNKLAYDLKVPFTTVRLARWGDPRRGEIVVLFSPHDGKRLVKRVVGVPGDRVEMKEHRLIINGRVLDYRPFAGELPLMLDADSLLARAEVLGERVHVVLTNPERPSMASFEPVEVPAGAYLVMGDYRDNSFDSRAFGFVERRRIVGRATAVALSVDWGRFRPRWHRFLTWLN